MSENYNQLTEEQKLVESVKHGEIYYALTHKKLIKQESTEQKSTEQESTAQAYINHACADSSVSNRNVQDMKRTAKDYTIWKRKDRSGGIQNGNAQFCSPGMPLDKIMEKIRDYLLEHYTEVEGVSELAEQFGYSRYHLMHSFKRIYGVTVHNFIEALKVRKAEELLIETNQMVRIVSVNCGFHSDTYFIRDFRKVTGFTPEEYRRRFQHREDTTEQ